MDINKLLETYGWVIECYSPYEVRHEDGSFATGQAASIVTENIREEFLDELLELTFEEALFRCANVCCEYRIIKRDDELFMETMDFYFDGVNLELEKNIVKKASYG